MSTYDRQNSDAANSGIGTAQVYNLVNDTPDSMNQTTFKTPAPGPAGPSDPFSSHTNASVVSANE